MPTIKLRNNLLAILLCLATTAIAARTINPDQVGLYHDDGIYMILGKSLSEGKGLRLTSLPSIPYQAKYPPVYPFIVSFIWRMVGFPENIFWIKLINIGFLFLVLLETYYISYILLEGKGALAALATVLTGTSAGVVYFSANVLSEIPYLFFSLTTVLLLLIADRQGRVRGLIYLLAILCASLSYQTKVAGVTLFLAFIAYLLAKKRYKWAIIASVLIVALNLPWTLWAKNHALPLDGNTLIYPYTGYYLPTSGIDSFCGWAEHYKTVLLVNMRYLLELIASMVIDISARWKPVMIFVWAILLSGLWGAMRDRRWLLFILYPALYILLCACLPVFAHSKVRYLAPMAPFVFAIFMQGMEAIYTWFVRYPQCQRLRLYYTGTLAILLLQSAAANLKGAEALSHNPDWVSFEETFAWIEKNTAMDAVIACSYDPIYYLYTGRRALRPWLAGPVVPCQYPTPYVGNPDEYFGLLKKLEVDYLLEEPMEGPQKEPVMEFYRNIVAKRRAELEPVFVSSDSCRRVYRLRWSQDEGRYAGK